MTPDNINREKARLSAMSQFDLAYLWRFSPAGTSCFSVPEIYEHFKKVFAEKGGMTPEISKDIGWDR
jgi:hypothetical protein